MIWDFFFFFFYPEVVWKDLMTTWAAKKEADTRLFDIHEGYKNKCSVDQEIYSFLETQVPSELWYQNWLHLMWCIIYRRWGKTVLDKEEKTDENYWLNISTLNQQLVDYFAGYQGLYISCSNFRRHNAGKISDYP